MNMKKHQTGNVIVGIIIGVVLGLAAALAVAVYVTKVPVPFLNKGQSRTPDQDAAEIMLVPPVELPVRRKAQRRLVPFVVAAVLLATVALAASAFARVSGANAISVPGLVGRTEAGARALARHAGLRIGSVGHQASSDPVGVVVSQSPSAGTFTSARRVNLVLSAGPPLVAVANTACRLGWAGRRAGLGSSIN